MGSGNSGSMQSSTDEEYESQNDTISAFLGSSGNHHMPMPPPRPPTSNHLPSTSLFDSLSPYLDVGSPRAFPPVTHSSSLDTMPWTRTHRPDNANCTDHGGIMWSTPQLPSIPASSTVDHYAGISTNTIPLSSSSPSASTRHSTAAAPPRGSKKRSRASRRAPTTVLTTDTSNFRQMVQEFTGIPSLPFSSLAFPARPRLDLLHAAPRWEPSSLLRQLAQKLPVAVTPNNNSNLQDPFSPLSSSPSGPSPTATKTSATVPVPTSSTANHGATNISTAVATSTAVTSTPATQNPTVCVNASAANPSPTSSYQLPNNQNATQNPILHSLLRTPPQPQKLMTPDFWSKAPTSTAAAAMIQSMGASWLPSTFVGSEGMQMNKSSSGDRGDHRHHHHLSAGWSDRGSSMVAGSGGGNSQRLVVNGVLADKGQLENVSSRTTGRNHVDSSWICSLD